MERVPIGDLRNNSTSPRRDVFKLMTGMEELRKCHAIFRMTNHATSLLTCLNMFKIVDFRFRASTSCGFQCEEEWFVWWNGSDSFVKSSLTMVSGWYGFPLFGKSHHCSGVQDSESKQMIEFQADSVHGPMEATFGIKEGISFGSEYSQMLHVSPSQFSAEISNSFFNSDFTWNQFWALLGFEGKGKNSSSFWSCRRCSGVSPGTFAIQISGCHSRIRVFGAIWESWCQSWGTTFVVMGVFTSVDCRIDGNGPHGSGITVAIAIVVFSAISGGPYVNVTKAFASLKIRFTWNKNGFVLHNNLRRPYHH